MSSGVQDLWRRRNDPGYLNWLAVGDALILLGYGLRKYAEIKMKELHALITTNVGGAGVKCHCKCTPGKKPNPHGRSTHCVWAQELKRFHVISRKSDIPWHQSTSSQWDDPNLGYWEIAKLFMSDLGKDRAKTKDPCTTDVGPLLNMLIFCKHFKVQQALLKAVKDWRNKWAHSLEHTLSDVDKQNAFKDIESLMNDPELVVSKYVQDCSPAIKRVETADVSILQDNELNIVQEFRRIQECQNNQLQEKLDKAEEENMILRKRDTKRDNFWKVANNLGALYFAVLYFIASSFRHKVPIMIWSLMASFMFFRVGHKSVISDEGCPKAMIKSPINHFHFQEFDFSSYLAYKREGFVGRKWFFLELESIFEKSPGISGVLVTGEPGSGKSALMSQLICSRFSSLHIHNNIIGYHLCDYSEPGKRDGSRFVRNLVDQIAARLPEYSKHVMNNEQLRTELNERCHKDPTGCFFTTIVGPLRKIKQLDDFQFIIIDALDECFESDIKTSEILDILHSKIIHFPKWLKVILTTRNLTSVTSKLPRIVNRTSLYATDERNVKDIRYYVSRYISQNSHFSDRLLTAIDITSRTDGMKMFLDEVITQAEGNFLFVKTTLQYINDTNGKIDFHSLPTSLFDLYSIFFNRQFGEDRFEPFKSLFEVLLAVYSPFQSQDIEKILKMECGAKDVSKLIGQVSCFLRFGRDGTVRIYHQSFAEWLKDQSHVLSINKTRGHQSIAKFLFRRVRQTHAKVTFEDLTQLFIHILSGRAFEMQEAAVDLFNITEMREPETNQSILHHLVTKPSIYLPVLDFFLKKFQTVDVLDANNKTPAFYAASEGFVQSLQSCINNGADVGPFLEGYEESDPLSVVVRNKGIEEFSLMHQAVAKGHTDIVELLLRSNVSFPDYSKNYPTPLHLAAGSGRLEVVTLFYNYGEPFDQITLHHAVARNHLPVVKFLLSTVGQRDTCVSCEPEHFTQLKLKVTVQEIHSYFCETALHAAVSRGQVEIVKVLLASGKEALECKHHSGKTVLMDAVERNDSEMVDLLLEHGANVTNNCGWSISEDSNRQFYSISSMYQQDFLYKVYCDIYVDSCECGHTALHLSAKFGLWNMAEKFISRQIDVLDLVDCYGNTAIDFAIVYDQVNFVQSYNISRGKINEINIVEVAVTYCSATVAKLFLDDSINYMDENLWNLLLQTVCWSPCYKLKSNVDSYCLRAFRYSNLSEKEKPKKESERRLNIMHLVIEAHQQKLSLLFNKKDDTGMTLLHYAALFGFEDAVKYLVRLGADTLLKDNNGNTPLMIALKRLPVDDVSRSALYRCYTTNDSQFSSCNTTCYDETIRFLIQSQKSNISKCDNERTFLLKEVLVNRLPLSLYALLKAGIHLNCKFNGFSSAWLLHLFEGGAEVSEVLKMFEVDVSPKCEVPFLDSELHLMSYLSVSDDFGNFFKPSFIKKRSPFQRLIDRHPKGVRILDECYDAEGLLPIHRAAQSGNIAAIKWFNNVGANTQAKTRDGLTSLDISILSLGNENARAHLLARFVKNPRCQGESFEELLRTFFDTSTKNYSSDISWSTLFPQKPVLHLATQYRLDVLTQVYNKALEIIPALKENKFLILDEQDVNGETPLHIAVYFGFEEVVKYLVRLGADINVRNNDGHTPLLIAIKTSHDNSLARSLNHRCYTTSDGLFTSCETTPHDEIARNLISSQKSSISQCDADSVKLLNIVVAKRMPLSLYALLKEGVDVNCKSNASLFPFLRHILREQPLSDVLKIFEVDVTIKCEVPFMSSELHLLSFLPVSGNFFKISLNKRRSPLQRLIDRHPKGVRILDECYDAEGYLPIHRATQGGNLAVITWFKNIGVNDQLRTPDGFTALEISTIFLKNKNDTTHLFKRFGLNPRGQNQCFEELLQAFFDNSPKNYSSDISSILFAQKPILHLATQCGLDVLTEVYKKALEIIPALKKNKFLILDERDVNGQTPLHIAAQNGLDDVVKYLVRLGADINIKDKAGNTPLLIALKKSHDNSTERGQDRRCYTTNDGLFTSCETTPHDEIGRSLISSQKSSISQCDAESVKLLNLVIVKQMPLSLYALLKEGVDVNCKGYKSLSPFLRHKLREQPLSEVLKIFEVDVTIKCEVPFMSSELHLISFLSVSGDFGNFFKPSVNKKRSPLQRLIDRHPKGVRILDECYDAEGYLPIHRAALSGNIAAIKWFKNIGVNNQLRARDGFSALEFSTASLKTKNDTTHLYEHFELNPRSRSESFEELLRTFFDTSAKNYSSDTSLSILFTQKPILHLATQFGLEVLTEVYNKALEIIPALKKNKFLILDEPDVNGQTPLHIAAQNGLDDVVKYLVRLGAEINIKDKAGDTPLLIALKMSRKRSQDHRCYTTNDDLFTSCSTTSYDEIGKFLIWSQKSTISKCDAQSAYLLNQVVVKQMPLALYTLLKVGVDINCKENQLVSPFLQHLRIGRQHVSEVLKIFEVDISVECRVPFMQSELHLISYKSVSGAFGNFFKPSLNRKHSPLQRLIDRHPRGVHILNECYDDKGYLPIHRAAQGGNLDAIKWFKSVGVKIHRRTRSVKTSLKTRGDHLTALDISILYLRDNHRARIISCLSGACLTSTSYRSECFKLLLQTLFNISLKKHSSNFPSTMFSEHRILQLAAEIGVDVLKDVYKKALKVIPGLKRKKFLILNEQDADGQTPLHIAAQNGLDDVVKYLVRLGANINIQDKDGVTPLFAALQSAFTYIVMFNLNHRCYTTNDGVFTSCNTTSHDEIIRFLIWSQKSTILKCDSQSAYLLNQVIKKRMPLSLYALLKVGVDINCKENQLVSPFLQHLRIGGQHVSEVLKMFDVKVSVKCGVPFKQSELHLMSYVSVSGDFGNFFKPSLSKKRSPLQRLINHHPRGVGILEECYDEEGFLPIHRAAQGGNLDAIKWFKSVRVNTQLETRSSLTALDISVTLLKKKTKPRYRRECFEELLRTFFYMSHKNYSSDTSYISFPKHGVLHLAAEMESDVLTEVYNKALEIIPSLKKNKFVILDEQDVNGDTPLHIAAYFGVEDVVKCLVTLGADINIKNKDGDTPLLAALVTSPANSVDSNVDHRCYTTNDGMFTSCKTTPHDEIVRYLISSQKSVVSKCDAESTYLLNLIIRKRMPLSLYALLRNGVGVNCQAEEFVLLFSQHLGDLIFSEGGRQVIEVLKIFEVDVFVKCDIS